MLGAIQLIHGEQLLWFAAGAVLLYLALHALLYWWIARRLRPRCGFAAYLVAAVPFVAMTCAFVFQQRSMMPHHDAPVLASAAEFRALTQGLKEPAHFSLGRVAFYRGKMYVGTNLGLAVVEDARVTGIWRFQKTYSVVSGPWVDEHDDLLWVRDDATQEYVHFDGTSWTRVSSPNLNGRLPPISGLDFADLIGNSRGFWLNAGSTAWLWDNRSQSWQVQPSSKKASFEDGLLTILPIREPSLELRRRESLPFLIKQGEDFKSDYLSRSSGAEIPLDATQPFFADSVAMSDSEALFCTNDGRVLLFRAERLSRVQTPSVCETVESGTGNRLFVSLRGLGVFEVRSGILTKRADSPYTSGAGEYWAHFAVEDSEIAFAIAAKPVVKPHTPDTETEFTTNAPSRLWWIRNGVARVVEF